MVQPGKGTFNDPAPRKDNEALLVIGAKHELKPKATTVCNPIEELASIAAINPDQTQFFAGAWQPREQQPSAVPILDCSGSDNDCHEQAQRIDEQMAFASVDLFAFVVATNTCDGGRFDTLAIQTTSRRMLVPPGATPYFGS